MPRSSGFPCKPHATVQKTCSTLQMLRVFLVQVGCVSLSRLVGGSDVQALDNTEAEARVPLLQDRRTARAELLVELSLYGRGKLIGV